MDLGPGILEIFLGTKILPWWLLTGLNHRIQGAEVQSSPCYLNEKFISFYKEICCQEGNTDIATAPECRNLTLNHSGHRVLYTGTPEELLFPANPADYFLGW